MIFKSHSTFHKSIFGSVPNETEDLVLRVTSETRLDSPKLHIERTGGAAVSLLMNEDVSNKVFVYACKVPGVVISQIGIYSYYFSYLQENMIVKVGQDSQRKSEHTPVASFLPFKLTVFNKCSIIPEWFKRQCFYHIFVDSFYSVAKKDLSERDKIGYLKVNDGKVEKNERRLMNNLRVDFDSLNDCALITHNEMKGRGVFGGDINGVNLKLDYLQDLGVTSLYLSPIFFADSNHKYNSSDFMSLDPHYGVEVKNIDGCGLNINETRKENDLIFSSFCTSLKERNMNVILDGVFNHCGVSSIYFDRQDIHPQIGAYPFWSKTFDLSKSARLSIEDAKKQVIHHYESIYNPENGLKYKYPDDFSFINLFDIEPVKMPSSEIYEYHAWAGYTSLPCFSRKEPEVGDDDGIAGFHVWNNMAYRNYFFGGNQANIESVVEKWARLGNSGWRMDATPEISIPSWRKISRNVQAVGQRPGNKPHVLIGEVWQTSPQYLLGDTYHSLTNYPLKDIIDAFMIKGNGESFVDSVEHLKDIYPKDAFYALFNMLSSHDTNRLFHVYNSAKTGHDPFDMMACAYGLLLTLPGVPVIYYGDEIGMDGERDPDNRRPFPWGMIHEQDRCFTLDGKRGQYRAKIKEHISRRKSSIALTDGDLVFLCCSENVVVFLRSIGTQYSIVISNRSNVEQFVQFDAAKLPKNIALPLDGLIARVADIYHVKAPSLSTEIVHLDNHSENALTPVAFLSTSGETICWSKVHRAVGYRVYGANSPFKLTDNHHRLVLETNNTQVHKEQVHYKHIIVTPFDSCSEQINAKSVMVGDNFLFECGLPTMSVVAQPTYFEIKSQEAAWLFRVNAKANGLIEMVAMLHSGETYEDHEVDSFSEYQYVLLGKMGELEQSALCQLRTDVIEICINAHIPIYTPENELLTMIHRGNGWCLKEAPLQRLSSTLHQYRTTGRVGDRFEAINFCRRHSGFCASVIYLSGVDKDQGCSSNWGYFDFDTHISTTVQETEKGRFVYDVYVNRWIDIPIAAVHGNVILGGYENHTEHQCERIDFSVPRDVRFFVNNIEVDVVDGIASVEFNLSNGLNEFTLHLELVGRHLEKYGFKESKYQENIVRPTKLVFMRH